MGVTSTITIPRAKAISRIIAMKTLASNYEYRVIEDKTNEVAVNIKPWVESDMWDIDLKHIKKWTNYMLEQVMDKPCFRYSMFENYNVVDD